MRDIGMAQVIVRSANQADYGEMFTLQRAAFVDESRLYGTPNVPALKESLSEFVARLTKSDSWVAVDQRRIVGAVSLRNCTGAPAVERLMVAPDRRGEGISSTLLNVVEHAAIDAGFGSIQLVVGDLAVESQQIYLHLGWRIVNSYYLPDYEHVLLHSMTKNLIMVSR